MPRVKKRVATWEKAKPLLGRRIVVTRERSQARPFVRAIEELGGEAMEFPTIEILPPKSYDPLDTAIQRIERYDWLIFTSVNGVKHFLDRMRHCGRDTEDLKETKIAAIGPETASALEAAELRVALMPREYRAEGILQEITPEEMRGRQVLVPRAAEARDVIPETLRQWGAAVDVVEAYRTVMARSDATSLRKLLLEKKIDMVTFTSSSTVKNFNAFFSGEDLEGRLAGAAVACIGPITQKTAEELGIPVHVVAEDYTITGLTRAIVEYFNRQ